MTSLPHPPHPGLSFFPSWRPRLSLSYSCWRRTSKSPAKKNSETGRKGRKSGARGPEMKSSRGEGPEEGKERGGGKRAEEKGEGGWHGRKKPLPPLQRRPRQQVKPRSSAPTLGEVRVPRESLPVAGRNTHPHHLPRPGIDPETSGHTAQLGPAQLIQLYWRTVSATEPLQQDTDTHTKTPGS